MHDYWLLSRKAYEALLQAMSTYDMAGALDKTADSPDAQHTIKDGVMHIPIVGLMSKRNASPLMRLIFGAATDYNSVIAAIAEAEANAEIKSVLLNVDSPGGNVNGIFEAVKAVRNLSKPSAAVVRGQAMSGGYMFAAATDKIIVQNPADLIGSIGIVAQIHVSENEIKITSSNAPFKAPDPKTEAGFKAIQEELDMLHNHMVKGIAEDRNVEVDVVNSEFGKGSVLTADIALRRGMIDSIGLDSVDLGADFGDDSFADVSGAQIDPKDIEKIEADKEASRKLKTGGQRKMKLSELLATDGEAKAEYDTEIKTASTDGRKLGVTDERKRVVAHLSNIGHSAEVATKAIIEGSDFDQPAMSAYMNAGMKQSQGKQRVDDNGKPLNTADGDDDLDGGKGKEVAAVIDKALAVDTSKSGIFA